MRVIYQGSTSFIAASAFGLSLVLASYFGPDLMEESSNLNWAVYNGGTGSYDEESGKMINVALWAKFISKYVLYYPAVDGISTFVLCAISLGGIIKGAWYGSSIHDLKETWKQRLVFRLLGFVPQIIGAAFVRDISSISRLMVEAGLTTMTQYSNVFSNEGSAWMVAILGVVLIIYAIIGLATKSFVDAF
eukprot:scaffold115889_cov41-Attheya_sp.AAC.3